MQINFTQIVKIFEDYQVTNQKVIPTFYFGDPQNLTQKDMLFPAMLLTPLPGDILFEDPGVINLRFALGVVDKLNADNNNLVYIIDNTMNIAIDMMTELGEWEEFNIMNSTFEVGFPTFDYLCAGTNITFTLQVQIANCGKLLDLDIDE